MKASESAHNFTICVESGGLDWLKQSGFYIDIDEQFNLIKPKEEFVIDVDAVSEIIEFAERSLSMLRKSKPIHAAMVASYEVRSSRKIPKFTEVIKTLI